MHRPVEAMSFEPEKFFIGLMDFFSILLPGALLSYALKDSVGPHVFGSGYYRLSGAEGWVVFLFAAYLFGHFIFLIGARFLDDYLYDPIRSATAASRLNRLARGKRLPWRITKWLAKWLIKKQGEADKAVYLAERIKEHTLDRVGGSSSMNSF